MVESAVGVVMRSVTQLVVPQFVALLEKDYGRWVNGTRDAAVSFCGTLQARGQDCLVARR